MSFHDPLCERVCIRVCVGLSYCCLLVAEDSICCFQFNASCNSPMKNHCLCKPNHRQQSISTFIRSHVLSISLITTKTRKNIERKGFCSFGEQRQQRMKKNK